MPEVLFPGCTSQPLLSYLKALGVLKLVSSQADAGARGAWHGTAFVLASRLTPDEIFEFFARSYAPSPILSPWNKDGGFQAGDTFEDVLSSESPRWQPFRRALEAQVRIHDALIPPELPTQARKKQLEQHKEELLCRLTAGLDDDASQWLETCFAQTGEGWKPFFLVGSGGNDGRLDYSSTYLTHLRSILPFDAQEVSPNSRASLEKALWDRGRVSRSGSKAGQFHPSGAGGPNMTTGFGGASAALVNPWDFVLGLEGALLMTSGVSRRLEASARRSAVFPFTFEALRGLGASTVDSEDVRVELWLPLWARPARLAEVRALFSEARARVGRSAARNSLDMARAVVSRGIDRGIRSFQRYEVAQRNGMSYFAVPAGVFQVRDGARAADLLRDVDAWMDSWRRATRDADKTPAARAVARRTLDRAAFELCLHGGPARVASMLAALGRAQCALGQGPRFREDARIRPLPHLRVEWVRHAAESTPELALALSLARMASGGRQAGKLGSVREALEPLERTRTGGWEWRPGEADGGLLSGRLEHRLLALLQARVHESDAAGNLPVDSTAPAPLAAVAAFLERRADDGRLGALTHALLALEPGHVELTWPTPSRSVLESLPRAYALLKLLFLPRGLWRHGAAEPVRIRPEAAILALLRSGRVRQAVQLASRRLRSHGLQPLGGRPELDHADPLRLAAALTFPISRSDATRLASLVLVPEGGSEALEYHHQDDSTAQTTPAEVSQ